MGRTLLNTLLPLASILLVSCGGEDPIAPGPDTGPVTAYIDGEAFVAEVATVSGGAGGLIVNARGSGDRSIEFRFPNQGAANYLIGIGNEVSAEVTIGSDTWVAEGSTGSGSITVEALFPSFMEGTFRFTLQGGPSQTTLRVTSGRFWINGF